MIKLEMIELTMSKINMAKLTKRINNFWLNQL
jgi:hypothetical protein